MINKILSSILFVAFMGQTTYAYECPKQNSSIITLSGMHVDHICQDKVIDVNLINVESNVAESTSSKFKDGFMIIYIFKLGNDVAEDLQYVNKLNKKLEGKGMRVLCVSAGGNIDEIKIIKSKIGSNAIFLFDENGNNHKAMLHDVGKLEAYPVTVIADRCKCIRYVHVGKLSQDEAISNILEDLSKENIKTK